MGRRARPDSPRRRAGAPARPRVEGDRCTSAGVGARGRASLRLRRPAEGRRHARRDTGRRRHRRLARAAVARDGRHRRRPDGNPRRVPRQGHASRSRGGSGGRRPAASIGRGAAACGARRRRLDRRAAARSRLMHRSQITIDLAALRRNTKTLLQALAGSELWAVVKADGYGHGAIDVAGAALGAGATGLCVATVPEGLALRRDFPSARIVVMGPAGGRTGPRCAPRARRGFR